MPKAEQTVSIQLTLDGKPRTITVEPTRSALSVLRDELGVTSLAAGCSPQGICGCCLALVNGKPRITCTLKAKQLDGKTIETQAALSAAERAALTDAFAACGAAQCGYCTPGITAQAACLLRSVPDPDDEVIDKAMGLHVCRCTGWTRIRDAVRLAGRLLADPAAVDLPTGLSTPESRAAILGGRTRIADMVRPGMRHLAVCLAPHPRCRLTRLDPAPATATGALVLTAAELPGARLVAAGEEARSAADAVALVLADTPEAARAAAALIAIEAESLPAIIGPDAEGAAVVARATAAQGTAPSADPRLRTARLTVTTPALDPAYLEPDAVLAIPLADGALHLYSGTQDLFAERAAVAEALGLDPAHVQVEAVPCGGAFGGRGAARLAIWAAAAAQHTGRPVHVALTHEDASRIHPGQGAARLSLTIQARPGEAQLASLQAELRVDAGAWSAGDVQAWLARAAALLPGPYAVAHLEVQATAVQTDSPPTSALRGLGGLPGAFALERALDQLAVALEEEPLALRRRLLADPAAHGPVLDALAAPLAAARAAGQAAGVACAAAALGLGGPEEVARAVLEVCSSAEVRIHTGFSEAGQGIEPRLIQAAAAVSGLPEAVFTVQASTRHPVESGPTLAGVDRWLGVQAVEDAARRLAADSAVALAARVGRTYGGEARTPVAGEGFAARGCAAVLALLDTRGGVERLIVAAEAGDEGAADPVGVGGQIEGAAHMGLGVALAEERAVGADGLPETQYRKLGVLKARVSPPIQAILCRGGGGVRPTDDAVLLAVPAAVAAALEAAGQAPEAALPMSGSAAARAAGIRPRKA